jgi:hypothetical protein
MHDQSNGTATLKARVRARVNYREDIPKDEDAILQILEEADMLEKDSKFDVSEEAAFTPEEDNQGDDQDCEDTGSSESFQAVHQHTYLHYASLAHQNNLTQLRQRTGKKELRVLMRSTSKRPSRSSRPTGSTCRLGSTTKAQRK